jgi:hypothetical protein
MPVHPLVPPAALARDAGRTRLIDFYNTFDKSGHRSLWCACECPLLGKWPTATQMSASDSKADIDEPFLTDRNLWVRTQPRHLSEAAGTRIDRLYLGAIVSLIPIAIAVAPSAGASGLESGNASSCFSSNGGFSAGSPLFLADATLTEPPI